MGGVSAWSQDDAWSVGSAWDGSDGYYAVIEHWDGSRWSVGGSLQSLGGTEESFYLNDVTAVGPGEMWAVGSYSSESDRRELIVHCKLEEACQIAPHLSGAFFTAVSAASANDIWATGSSEWLNGGSSRFGHYDGTTWSLIPAPDERILSGIDARAADDAWAVGFGKIEHWNGSEWSVVPGAGVPGSYIGLRDVVALDVDNVWAVGSFGGLETAILHWNGQEWTRVSSPNPGNTYNVLAGVDAVSPNDIWAVGVSYSDDNPSLPKVMSLHWDGAQWSVVPNPGYGSPYEGAGDLYSVAAPAHNYVLTVGYRPDEARNRVLWTGQLYRNRCPSVSCPVQFADLPSSGEGSTFYVYAHCLSCRGVISGYACGGAGEPCNDQYQPYFRPAVNVTRGQISKMVALAAGLSGSTGEQSS
jgi:hypothetical protein